MNSSNKFIEIQGTAEKQDFSMEELMEMLNLAKSGINNLLEKQKLALNL